MPRRPLLSSADWIVLTIAFAVTAATCVVWEWDHRAVNNALSVLVVSLLLWRLLGTWHELTVLEHVMVFLLIVGPITATAASLSLLATTTTLPENPWLWLVTVHRLGMAVLAIWWRRWLGRRHSPFRRTEA